jgi:XTP/dITP diphosphohydrolase
LVTNLNNVPILFCTRNQNKFREAQKILSNKGISLLHEQVSLSEPQCDQVTEVARFSAVEAYRRFQRPLIVEDTGLYIQALKGFPGAYAAYVEETIGNPGIIRLLKNSNNRSAFFQTAIAYIHTENMIHVIDAKVPGTITLTIRQNPETPGWGYDPIFIPDGYTQTFAEMGPTQKNRCSHRHKAFKLFSQWYTKTKTPSP